MLLKCLRTPPGGLSVPSCLAAPRALASTEHVVCDADPSGGLADLLLHNGQVHHLQDTGLHLTNTGCPHFLQVAPACYAPFVSIPEQSLRREKELVRTNTSRSLLAPTPSLIGLSLKYQNRENIGVHSKTLRPGKGTSARLLSVCQAQNPAQGPEPYLYTVSLSGRHTGWM